MPATWSRAFSRRLPSLSLRPAQSPGSNLSNLHSQLGRTVVFEQRLGQLLQKRVLRAHQLRRERSRQVETERGDFSWGAPHSESLLGVHTQPETARRTPFAEKGRPKKPPSQGPPGLSLARRESGVRGGTPTQTGCRVSRTPIGGGVHQPREPTLRLVQSSAPAHPPRSELAVAEEAHRPRLPEAGPRALPVRTKMVALFRSGSLSIGLSTDISAAPQPASSSARIFQTTASPASSGRGGARIPGGLSRQS